MEAVTFGDYEVTADIVHRSRDGTVKQVIHQRGDVETCHGPDPCELCEENTHG